MSGHLPAGLQPRVRAEAAGGELGHTARSWGLTFWLLGGRSLPPERPCLRQGPVGSPLPGLPSEATMPTGQRTSLQPHGWQADPNASIYRGDAAARAESWGAGIGQRPHRIGDEHVRCRGTHDYVHKTLDMDTHAHTHTHINATQKPPQNPRTQTHTGARTRNTSPSPHSHRPQMLGRMCGLGDLGGHKL